MCANGPVSINFGNVSMLLSAKLTSAFLSSVFFFTNFFQYGWFTVLCQFLLYHKVNELCKHMQPLSFRFCSHVGCVRVGSHVGQSRTTLGDPVDSGPPGPSVHGIFQAKILEWVVISYSGDLPNLGIKPESPASPELAGGCFVFFFLTLSHLRDPLTHCYRVLSRAPCAAHYVLIVQLSVLYIAVCVCQSQSPDLCLPDLFTLVTVVCFLYLTQFLFCKRFFCTIFLDST